MHVLLPKYIVRMLRIPNILLSLPPTLLMVVYWMKHLRWFSSWISWNDNLRPIQLWCHFPTQPDASHAHHTVCLLSILVLKIIFVCRIIGLPESDKAGRCSGKASNLAPIQIKFFNIWIEHLMTSNFHCLIILMQHGVFSISLHCLQISLACRPAPYYSSATSLLGLSLCPPF